MHYRLFVISLILACTGTTATEPDQRRQLGTIAGYQLNDPLVAVVPSGRTVTVSVTTYGGGCDSKGETEVAVTGLTAVVTPYDYWKSATGACPDILRTFAHSTTIEFVESGTAEIIVRGLDWRTRTAKNPDGDTLSVVRSVEVRDPPGRVLRLGLIAGFNNDDPRVTLTQDGRRVDLSITTYGGGCESKGITEVVLNGLNADVTPYDYTAQPGTTCTRELRSFVHQASLQFAEGGTAQIRIRGIDIRARTSGNPLGDTVTVVRTVAIP